MNFFENCLEKWGQTLEKSSLGCSLERTNIGRVLLNVALFAPIVIAIVGLNTLEIFVLSYPLMCIWNWFTPWWFGFHEISFSEAFVLLMICSMSPKLNLGIHF